jgi:hypothetical protein
VGIGFVGSLSLGEEVIQTQEDPMLCNQIGVEQLGNILVHLCVVYKTLSYKFDVIFTEHL